MSIINNGLLLASGADAPTTYQISRSLRFNSADSAYLSRTPGSAGNRKTWTWSGWVKRSAINSRYSLFVAATGGNNQTEFFFEQATGADTLHFYHYDNAYLGQCRTVAVFRDTSAWYHIVLAVDTTQATASNRCKIYVNGVQQDTTFTTNFTQNADLYVNATNAHAIGYDVGNAPSQPYYFDGYIADVYLLDGTATTPSTFAETDAITGQWVPKTPTGISYGTNGFRLTFSDNSGTTSTTLGKDAAGSNNFTPNNFSVASGSGNDSLVDSPSSYGTPDTGVGGEVRGNYCTLNAIDDKKGAAPTNGNLELAGTASCKGTFGLSTGKWYFEFVVTSISGTPMIGVATEDTKGDLSAGSAFFLYRGSDGQKQTTSGASSYGASYTSGDVIGVAFNADTSQITFYKNNTSQGAISVTSGNTYFPMVVQSTGGTYTFNFGARAFSYTAPSGFKALVDTNLTSPTIAKPANYFDVKLYTGNGGTQTISGLNFGPEFVWYKHRSAASSHGLFDAIRGTSNYLTSNSTGAEQTVSGVTAFTSDGFTLGTDTGGNGSGTWVAWCWDAASSNSTNTQGSITSTVRANATAGFSIVTYTGNNTANATFGHGLGATPEFVIIKKRSTTGNWIVYHKGMTSSAYYMYLNATDAQTNQSGAVNTWGVSSTLITLKELFGDYNANGATYVAYCFAPVTGYSAFGSYTGNGSTDGPFVYTGFRPRWLLVKRSDSTSDWIIYDAARDTYNVMGKSLYPSLSNAEIDSPPRIDFLSNGFKLRVGGSSEPNWSSSTVIYACFAESPFQYARAR